MTILTELAELADELEQLDTRREQIYEQRLDLWLRGRAVGFTQATLAEPSRVTSGAVKQALRKHHLREPARSRG